MFGPSRASNARSMRPILPTFGAPNPATSPASKYRRSALLRKVRITRAEMIPTRGVVK